MVPAEGRTPAEKVKIHLVNKLESFGIDYKKDTINGTLDGCTTNIKLGRLLKKLLQLCLAHGFQLGIVKTLYVKKKKKNNPNSDENENDDETNEDESTNEDTESEEEEEEADVDSGDEEDDYDMESGDEEEVFYREEQGLYQEAPEEEFILDQSYEKVIQKLRKIINQYGGRSTPRGDSLQDAIKAWQKEKVIITIYQTMFGR